MKKKTTISSRMLLGFLFTILIPTTILMILFFGYYLRSEIRSAESQVRITTDLVADSLEAQFDSLNTITMAPYYNSYFSASRSLDPDSPDFQSKFISYQNEMQHLFNLTTYQTSGITDLLVWSDGLSMYHLIYNELLLPGLLDNITQQPWYQHALDARGKMVFTPAHGLSGNPETQISTDSIYITRQIRNLHNPNQTSVVLLNLNTAKLSSNLSGLNLIYDSFVVITNENDELLYSSRALSPAAFQEISTHSDIHYDGSRWRAASTRISDYDLTVHVVYSLSKVYSSFRSYLITVVLSYLAALTALYFLHRRNTRWINDSVHSLLNTFERIEDGDLTARCEPVHIQEIDRIGQSVNEMTNIINDKIKQEYLMELRQKSLQLYALQAQIQPHFINNTIYCFIALNQIGEKQALNTSLYSLSHLLRYILKKEKETLLKEECSFLEDYFRLQQLRFRDRLRYSIDVPEEYHTLRIPRLLLQPLVENAIIHGIEPCSRPCTCRIICRRTDDHLILSVTDDGIGLDMDKLNRMQQELAHTIETTENLADLSLTREKSSIGLFYVRERLRLWSEDARLSIDRDGDLTVSELTIPLEVVHYDSSDRG